MKRWSLVVLALISAACSESNGSPLPPGTVGVSLREGPYTLRVTRAATGTCFTSDGGPGATVQLDATVSAVSDGWRVALAQSAAGDLVLTLSHDGKTG